MESLQAKTALITGAGKGIGKAIALAFAAEGINLAIISRTETDLQQVAREAAAINGNLKIAFAVADVASYASVSAAVTKLKETVGDIDILVNNAGIGRFGSFLELEVAQWEEVVKTNLFGTYYAIRAILPEMKARKSGDIVNVSSTAGLKGAPVTSAYSASKFAVNGLSESLMLEVRKENIRVMTLMPSTIATDMAKDLNLTDGNPEKVLQPEDLAALLVGHLKLPRRALVKEVGLWSTNP